MSLRVHRAGGRVARVTLKPARTLPRHVCLSQPAQPRAVWLPGELRRFQGQLWDPACHSVRWHMAT